METSENRTFLQKTYTVKEIADMEGVSIRTVYRWCVGGFLQYNRSPTKKGKGRIIVKKDNYHDFKKIFTNDYYL